MKLTKLFCFWTLIVSRIFLDILKFKKLDVLIHSDLSKGIGPNNNKVIQNTRNIYRRITVSFSLSSFLTIDFEDFLTLAIFVMILNRPKQFILIKVGKLTITCVNLMILGRYFLKTSSLCPFLNIMLNIFKLHVTLLNHAKRYYSGSNPCLRFARRDTK